MANESFLDADKKLDELLKEEIIFEENPLDIIKLINQMDIHFAVELAPDVEMKFNEALKSELITSSLNMRDSNSIIALKNKMQDEMNESLLSLKADIGDVALFNDVLRSVADKVHNNPSVINNISDVANSVIEEVTPEETRKSKHSEIISEIVQDAVDTRNNINNGQLLKDNPFIEQITNGVGEPFALAIADQIKTYNSPIEALQDDIEFRKLIEELAQAAFEEKNTRDQFVQDYAEKVGGRINMDSVEDYSSVRDAVNDFEASYAKTIYENGRKDIENGQNYRIDLRASYVASRQFIKFIETEHEQKGDNFEYTLQNRKNSLAYNVQLDVYRIVAKYGGNKEAANRDIQKYLLGVAKLAASREVDNPFFKEVFRNICDNAGLDIINDDKSINVKQVNALISERGLEEEVQDRISRFDNAEGEYSLESLLYNAKYDNPKQQAEVEGHFKTFLDKIMSIEKNPNLSMKEKLEELEKEYNSAFAGTADVNGKSLVMQEINKRIMDSRQMIDKGFSPEFASLLAKVPEEIAKSTKEEYMIRDAKNVLRNGSNIDRKNMFVSLMAYCKTKGITEIDGEFGALIEDYNKIFIDYYSTKRVNNKKEEWLQEVRDNLPESFIEVDEKTGRKIINSDKFENFAKISRDLKEDVPAWQVLLNSNYYALSRREKKDDRIDAFEKEIKSIDTEEFKKRYVELLHSKDPSEIDAFVAAYQVSDKFGRSTLKVLKKNLQGLTSKGILGKEAHDYFGSDYARKPEKERKILIDGLNKEQKLRLIARITASAQMKPTGEEAADSFNIKNVFIRRTLEDLLKSFDYDAAKARSFNVSRINKLLMDSSSGNICIDTGVNDILKDELFTIKNIAENGFDENSIGDSIIKANLYRHVLDRIDLIKEEDRYEMLDKLYEKDPRKLESIYKTLFKDLQSGKHNIINRQFKNEKRLEELEILDGYFGDRKPEFKEEVYNANSIKSLKDLKIESESIPQKISRLLESGGRGNMDAMEYKSFQAIGKAYTSDATAYDFSRKNTSSETLTHIMLLEEINDPNATLLAKHISDIAFLNIYDTDENGNIKLNDEKLDKLLKDYGKTREELEEAKGIIDAQKIPIAKKYVKEVVEDKEPKDEFVEGLYQEEIEKYEDSYNRMSAYELTEEEMQQEFAFKYAYASASYDYAIKYYERQLNQQVNSEEFKKISSMLKVMNKGRQIEDEKLFSDDPNKNANSRSHFILEDWKSKKENNPSEVTQYSVLMSLSALAKKRKKWILC